MWQRYGVTRTAGSRKNNRDKEIRVQHCTCKILIGQVPWRVPWWVLRRVLSRVLWRITVLSAVMARGLWYLGVQYGKLQQPLLHLGKNYGCSELNSRQGSDWLEVLIPWLVWPIAADFSLTWDLSIWLPSPGYLKPKHDIMTRGAKGGERGKGRREGGRKREGR